jgi:hypothetical protein
MPSPSVKQRLVKWLADQLPTVRRTIYNVRQMRTEAAPDLDVDRVHAIIEDAQAGNIDDLLRLYRDMVMAGSHLQGRFTERKEAVLGDTVSIQPATKTNVDDKAAAIVIQDLVDNCRDWRRATTHLLDSVLWPVSLLEKTYKVSDRLLSPKDLPPIRLQYELSALTVVPYELLVHIWGKLQIRDTDEFGNPLGTYQDPDPGRYIVGRCHLLAAIPDNWGGPMRSIIFWWLLGHMGRDWWVRYLDKYGMPFLVGKYDQGDDASRSILERAFSYASKIGGLVISKETEVALEQAAAGQSGDAFDKFVEQCNKEISNLVLGQSLSSNARSTGLGSGVAALQGEVRQDKRKSDAAGLAETLRYQLFDPYLRINGLKGTAPKLVFGSDSVNESEATGKILTSLSQAGLEPTDDALPVIGEKIGFTVQRSTAPVMPPPGVFGGPSDRFGIHSVTRIAPRLRSAEQANAAIVRDGAAKLAQALRKSHAPIVQLVATSKSPQDAIDRVKAYCASLDPLEAAEITESTLRAMAANGSVIHAA